MTVVSERLSSQPTYASANEKKQRHRVGRTRRWSACKRANVESRVHRGVGDKFMRTKYLRKEEHYTHGLGTYHSCKRPYAAAIQTSCQDWQGCRKTWMAWRSGMAWWEVP